MANVGTRGTWPSHCSPWTAILVQIIDTRAERDATVMQWAVPERMLNADQMRALEEVHQFNTAALYTGDATHVNEHNFIALLTAVNVWNLVADIVNWVDVADIPDHAELLAYRDDVHREAALLSIAEGCFTQYRCHDGALPEGCLVVRQTIVHLCET